MQVLMVLYTYFLRTIHHFLNTLQEDEASQNCEIVPQDLQLQDPISANIH
jgi:hypothetical protein